MAGELVIENHGGEPLVVSRVSPRTDESDPRLPPTVAVGGAFPITIDPHGSHRVVVTWSPEADTRQRQLTGHVVVTSSDEQTGEVAMGIRARLPGGPGRLDAILLPLLVASPLVIAVLLLVRARRRPDADEARKAGLVGAGVTLGLAMFAYARFSPAVGRADGNDGLQLVYHAPWARGVGAEVFLGLDGTAAFLVLVVALVAFAGLSTERRPPDGAPAYYATYLVALAGTLGFVVAFDLALLVLFGSIAVAATSLLVGAWGRPGREDGGVAVFAVGAFAMLALLVGIMLLVRHAEPSFLVDGTRSPWTFDQTELSRVAFAAKPVMILSVPLWKLSYCLVFSSACALLGAFPFHGWITRALSTARASAGVLTGVALPTLGLVVLLRVASTVLPEGMRWGSGVTVALGAVTVAYGGLLALGEDDVPRFAGASAAAQVGFVLLGAGSLTPQGIAGAVIHASGRALALALILLVAWVVEERTHERSIARLSGVARAMPRCGAVLAIGAIANAGVLGSVAGWGVLLTLFGALPNYTAFVVVAILGLAVVTAAQLRVGVRLLLAPLAPALESGPRVAALGGALPDLTPREQSSLVPLALVAALIGIWPGPILSTISGAARDVSSVVNPKGPGHLSTLATRARVVLASLDAPPTPRGERRPVSP